ncbi:MAG TPA: type II secretion system F family protein [Rhabdochlamydiaceae bacterium]|jgi:general secretion pathway protein F/type IV pilus assembly protein PilC|nr:type II secretion system F family protein [Rhabdochlamydiaceae bacterium]
MLYRYQALSNTGKKISGVVDADSIHAAKEKLRKEQILVINLDLFQEKKKEITIPFPFLLDLTRMLGQLLSAGIPLFESLVIIEEKYHSHRFHPLLMDLCDSLKTGLSLSETLRKYPQSFDPIYIAMVHAGEQTASLPTVFEELCALLERQQKLKKQLFSAAAYPAFLGGFCALVFAALLLFVIPSMKNLFEGRDLHPITRFVFGASDFVTAQGFIILIALLLFAAVIATCIKNPALRQKLDGLFLTLPFVGEFLREAATIRFCRTAALLLSGGLPILQTLQLSRHVMKNRLLEEVIVNAEQKISEGKSLSQELKASPLIPPIVPRMLAVAEETGKTAFMLQDIANICEENLEKKLQQFTAFLQPVLLLLLGLIVGVVLLSILIPMTDVGSALQT